MSTDMTVGLQLCGSIFIVTSLLSVRVKSAMFTLTSAGLVSTCAYIKPHVLYISRYTWQLPHKYPIPKSTQADTCINILGFHMHCIRYTYTVYYYTCPVIYMYLYIGWYLCV